MGLVTTLCPAKGERELIESFGESESFSKFYQISAKLRKLGSGATGIIVSSPPVGSNKYQHAFNIVNNNGTIRVFDGQLGKEILDSQLSQYLKNLDPVFFKFFNTTNK